MHLTLRLRMCSEAVLSFQLTVCREAAHRGSGHARNVAIERAAAEVAVFLMMTQCLRLITFAAI